MTNQELRDLVQTWKLTDECPYPGATEAITRLLDEHARMETALKSIYCIEQHDLKHPRPAKSLSAIGQIVRSVLANLAAQEEGE